MNRRTRSVGRRRPVRRPAARIVVATEGASTEPAYLRALNRLFADESVRLELVSGVGDPRAVVEQAIEELAKSKRDPLGNDDSVWAMFDRDAHDRFAEAKDLARGNGIGLAVSDPCFELWGIFHYRDQQAPLDRHECQRMLEELCPGYERKGRKLFGDMQVIEQHYADAVRRARQSLDNRSAEGNPEGNPSTTVYRLTEGLRRAVDRAKEEL
ncbi:MAG: RloB family protein [Rhodospirillales bacterium]|nr:RloB family protein [Rhodospirillales bacterium]